MWSLLDLDVVVEIDFGDSGRNCLESAATGWRVQGERDKFDKVNKSAGA